MAVYERRYGPFPGTKTPRNTRFMVLPTYSYKDLFKSKAFIVFLAVWGVWALLVLPILCYLPHNEAIKNFFKILPEEIINEFKFDAGFFFAWFMVPSMFVAYITAFVAGPALVSADLRNHGLPLYLARPFDRWEYILGKSAALLMVLSGVTWVPGLMLFMLQSYFAGFGWLQDNIGVAFGILITSGVWIALLTMTSLAISAYVKWKPVARLTLLLIFIALPAVGQVINVVLRTDWGNLLNLLDMTAIIATRMFGIENPFKVPLPAALTAIVAFCSFCIFLLSRKVRAYEVVKS